MAAFRIAFPEFSSTSLYPDQLIAFWSGIATQMVLPNIWTTMWQQGVSLYVAHELTLAGQNVKAAQVGGTPGQQGGIANNKTVGGVTVGYDSQSNSEKDAGYWNLTNYGKQFFRLMKIFGTRAVQL